MKAVHPIQPRALAVGTVLLAALCLLVAGCGLISQPYVSNPASFVDPFIGTAGPNHYREAANTVPGAVMPFGMCNFGPEAAFTEDLLNTDRARRMVAEGLRMPVSPGGYNAAASRIRGFSLTRLSGTGCMGASGDIPFLPFTGEILHSPDADTLDRVYGSGFSHDREQARPGYYQVALENGVNVELTATERTGLARFTYPEGRPARLLIRTSYSQIGSGDAFTQVDPIKGEITGYVRSGNFCGYLGEANRRDYYTLYFAAQLDVPIKGTGVWEDDVVTPGGVEARGGMPYGDRGIPKLGQGSGAWVDLAPGDDREVTLRVGISYVSVDNARRNLEAEQKDNDTVESVSGRAYAAWHHALSRIKVVSQDTTELTTFYTALYHAHFHPNLFSDVNGEYAGFDGQTHRVEKPQKAQYANFSGWDVYRSQLQLVALIHPKVAGDIAQSLYNQASQYGGVWDRWTHNNGPTAVMNGDPATIAMANFLAFGANQFDVKGAYASLAQAAQTPTALDLSDVGKPIFSRGQKPSLDQWLDLGYISDENNAWEGASETLEQASAYFALSQIAHRLGLQEDHDRFLAQSGNWRNLFNPQATDSLGYIQGRHKDGSWKTPFDPASPNLFVEGSPAQYLWMVPFDGAGLFERMGGPVPAARRLDHFFTHPDGSWALSRSDGAHSDLSNQPSLNAPWMYLFAGQAYKAQETLRAVRYLLWHAAPDGIPGQDDLGQMSSWYVFTTLGLYPLYPGRAEMVLGSPVFSKVRIVRSQGNIVIVANNVAPENIYVSSLTINGEPNSGAWMGEGYIKQGVKLVFEMSNRPNPAFGSLKDAPPSFSSQTK